MTNAEYKNKVRIFRKYCEERFGVETNGEVSQLDVEFMLQNMEANSTYRFGLEYRTPTWEALGLTKYQIINEYRGSVGAAELIDILLALLIHNTAEYKKQDIERLTEAINSLL